MKSYFDLNVGKFNDYMYLKAMIIAFKYMYYLVIKFENVFIPYEAKNLILFENVPLLKNP
jgi:hypothetical protein